MPLPSPFVYALFPLYESILNKDGTGPLSNGIVSFFSDPNYPTLKPIYQLSENPPNSGNITFTELRNPLILDGNGSFVDESGNSIIPYLYPYEGSPTDSEPGEVELYFITVYSSDGIFQFSRSAWPPNQPDISSGATTTPQSQNVLTNPQFAEVSFGSGLYGSPGVDGTYGFAVSGTGTSTPIAPSWKLVTSGSGTVTLQQKVISGTTNSLSQAETGLSISVGAGITAISLVQEIEHSPRFLSTAFIAGYFEVASNTGVLQGPFTLNYRPSNSGATVLQICQGNTNSNSNLNAVKGTTTQSPPTIINPDGYSGYIQIELVLPVTANVTVTSFQCISVSAEDTTLEFIPISTPQLNSQLFYYWQDALNYKPTKSFLVGWDFPLNPAQSMITDNSNAALHNPITFGGNNLSAYIWDQTILFQGTDASIDVSRSSTTNGLTLTMDSGATTTTAAIVQYLPAAIAREMLSQDLSISIQALNTGASIPCTVSLYYTTDASLPTIQAIPNAATYSLVSAVSSTGVPTVGGGGSYGTWTQIPRSGLQNPSAFSVNGTAGQTFDFSGFNAPNSTGDTTATYIAIVIGIGTMTYSASANQSITFNYVSCVPGKIPTRPAPQTQDEVLRECRYYYETSYDVGIALATTFGASPFTAYLVPSILSAAGSGSMTLSAYPTQFTIQYKEPKRAVPLTGNISIYNYALGTIDNIRSVLYANGSAPSSNTGDVQFSTRWSLANAGLNSATYIPTSATAILTTGFVALPIVGVNAISEINYVIDCRLGVL